MTRQLVCAWHAIHRKLSKGTPDMGPNNINTFNSTAALGTAAAPAEASTATPATAATAVNSIKIHYGDSIKADRLQAGLRGLQAAQAKTELFIRSINPDLGKL